MDQSITANRRTTDTFSLQLPDNYTNVIGRGLNALADSFNDLLIINNNNMPAYIVHEGYDDILHHLSELTNIVNAQYSEHRHAATMIARQRRRQWRREQFRERAAANTAAATLLVNERIEIDGGDIPRETEITEPVYRRRALARKTLVLKPSEMDIILPDPCSICMDMYTKINSVGTSCTHTFCKSCFDAYEASCFAKNDPAVACPLCRAFNPRITEFRARKPRTPVSRNVPMEMDDRPILEH